MIQSGNGKEIAILIEKEQKKVYGKFIICRRVQRRYKEHVCTREHEPKYQQRNSVCCLLEKQFDGFILLAEKNTKHSMPV